MEAKSIQLYQLAHKKLHLVEKDAMEFVDLVQGTIEERTDELVTKEYLNIKLMELEIKMVKSEKTGAYIFTEAIMAPDQVSGWLSKK